MRAVSLVPSITESLFDLGLGASLVGITDYCIYPAEPLERLPRIGGTKNPRLAEIVALKPDVIFANQEENTQAAVEGLRAAGLHVALHFPRTVAQAVADLMSIAQLYNSAIAIARIEALASQVAAARQRQPQPLAVFVPVWCQAGPPEWWMTLNQHTFTHDLLALCGFHNVFAARERRYPLAADLGQRPAQPAEGRDTRYPRVTAAELAAAAPQAALATLGAVCLRRCRCRPFVCHLGRPAPSIPDPHPGWQLSHLAGHAPAPGAGRAANRPPTPGLSQK